ncbi:hypothetical protein OG948_53375 (plasmid) [Embleya sp. NBC_00888]|uniref:hypothetical protein n=1 Tax=Embleya sp. NBC_00888 TaxID=2975960 RepID=UPI002F9077C1|nr:hypothetical protein OG948_53375 [Embleya sp. NBC_00888]
MRRRLLVIIGALGVAATAVRLLPRLESAIAAVRGGDEPAEETYVVSRPRPSTDIDVWHDHPLGSGFQAFLKEADR